MPPILFLLFHMQLPELWSKWLIEEKENREKELEHAQADLNDVFVIFIWNFN